MVRSAVLSLLLGLVAALLLSCSRQSQQVDTAPAIDLEVVFDPQPIRVGLSALTIVLSEEGSPIEGAVIHARGDMSHAGMKPVMAEAEERSPGLYSLALNWTMAGDWILTIDVMVPDGRSFVRAFNVTVGAGE
jgi:hypothetical protein